MPPIATKRIAFRRSLLNPKIYRFMRSALIRLFGHDYEKIHAEALETMRSNVDALKDVQDEFVFPGLEISINGETFSPFGTAAGFDKNCDAVVPLSYIFGFQEPGTIVVRARDGNKQPRLIVDESTKTIYNAQGFPSKGLDHALANLESYGGSDCPKKPLYLSIAGVPDGGTTHALDVAWEETVALLERLGPYASGFVWNPFSPNTETLKQLRTPEMFKRCANLLRDKSPDKVRLVKMGPFEEEERVWWMSLLDAWMEGEGHGIVAVNTKQVPKKEVPSESWGYDSAGKSSKVLEPYRKRAVRVAREAYPAAIIIGTGGIMDGEDAYNTFLWGANAVEDYGSTVFNGLGQGRVKMKYVSERLASEKRTLNDLQLEARKGARPMI